MFYVYRITNKLNNKVYLGKAKDVVKRFHVHMKVAKGGKEGRYCQILSCKRSYCKSH